MNPEGQPKEIYVYEGVDSYNRSRLLASLTYECPMIMPDFDGDQQPEFDDFEADFEVEYSQGLPRQPITEDKTP